MFYEVFGNKYANILLLTQDVKVIQKAESGSWSNQYNFYFFKDIDRSDDNVQNSILNNERSADDTLLDALAEIYLGAQGDVFVGTLSSSFGKLITLYHYGIYG